MSIERYQGIINSYDPKKKKNQEIKPVDVYGKSITRDLGIMNKPDRFNQTPGITPITYDGQSGTVDKDVKFGTRGGGGGQGGGQGGGEDVIVEETKTLDDGWKQIQQQIKMNTLNSKNEVAMAQRNASKNMDNYLKALGIQGTGLGQSAYVDLATQYSNQLAGINADENTAMQSAIDSQNKEIKDMIDNGTETSVVNDYIDNLKKQGFNTSNVESYQNAMVKTQAEQLFASMKEEFNSTNFSQNKSTYSSALSKLSQAIKSGDSKAIEEAYKFAYNVANGTPELNLNYTVDPTNNMNVYNVTEKDFGSYFDTGKKGTKQSESINRLIADSQKWHEEGSHDGTIVNVNYGAGEIHLFKFHSKEGVWEDLGKSNIWGTDKVWNEYNKKSIDIKDLYK